MFLPLLGLIHNIIYFFKFQVAKRTPPSVPKSCFFVEYSKWVVTTVLVSHWILQAIQAKVQRHEVMSWCAMELQGSSVPVAQDF